MDPRLERTIRAFYAGHLADRGGDPEDPLSLGWTSRERQEIRFHALCAAAGIVAAPPDARWTLRGGDGTAAPWGAAGGDVAGRADAARNLSTANTNPVPRVLDAGCGFGDLYGWMVRHGVRAGYVGADLLPQMVDTARAKWPGARFDLGAPSDLFAPASFDWVLASGFVCVYAGQPRVAHLRETAASLLALARTGAAFNLLDARRLKQEGALLTYFQDEAFAACGGLGASVEVLDGYLDNDFTVILRRN